MVTLGRVQRWFIIICVGISLASFAQELPMMELLEFLGEWTNEQGQEIDFDMFDDPREIERERISPPRENVFDSQ